MEIVLNRSGWMRRSYCSFCNLFFWCRESKRKTSSAVFLRDDERLFGDEAAAAVRNASFQLIYYPSWYQSVDCLLNSLSCLLFVCWFFCMCWLLSVHLPQCMSVYLYVHLLGPRLAVAICISVSLSVSVYLLFGLSICLTVCLFVCPSVYLFVCLSVYLVICLTVCLSVYVSVHHPGCMAICRVICRCIYLFVCLPVWPSSGPLFGWLSICLSICLFVCLSIFLCLHLIVCLFICLSTCLSIFMFL